MGAVTQSVPTGVPADRLPRSIFLTGATGFIGGRLVDALLGAGCDLTALVLPGEAERLPRSVRAMVGDITDADAVARALEVARPEGVFHLAAVGTTDTGLPMAEACRVNVGGMIALLEGIRRLDSVERIVVIGTSYEYGARRSDDGVDPFNTYSASKVAAWAYARAAFNAWGLPVVSVRPFQVYGPGQRREALVPAAILAALGDADFRMTGGEQQRDFIYVEDIVAGLLAAMATPAIEGRVLDLGTGTLSRILDVVQRVWDLTGSQGQILAGALPYRAGEVPAIPADARRTRLLTDWEARIPLDEGLSLTIDALRASAPRQGSRDFHTGEQGSRVSMSEGDHAE